jgi:hypothetical protein
MPKLFISYRRNDTNEAAQRLFADLQVSFSGEVFLDEGGGLRPGENFVDRLGQAIGSADVVLPLIGRQWLAVRGVDGRPRLHDPDDILRREIVRALKKKIAILPVLMDCAQMPRAEQLPTKLVPLAGIHAHRMASASWERDLVGLVERILVLLDEKRKERDALFDQIVEKGIEVVSMYPRAFGEQFDDMPVIGKWRIDVRSPSAPHPALGPAGHSALAVTLREDSTFVGELLVYRTGLSRLFGPRSHRLAGKWAIGAWDEGGLLLKLDAVVDGAHESQYRIPVRERMGDGYFARSADGMAYTMVSRGGRADRPGQL